MPEFVSTHLQSITINRIHDGRYHMKIAVCIVAALCIVGSSSASRAQLPGVIGTWKLNVGASRFPEPPPQLHVRSYRLADNGVLIGLAVIVDSQGRPYFLQFAAKPDGKDYPEFSAESAANYLSNGTAPPRTYAETTTSDPHKVKWVDKAKGKILSSGEKWVSADGKRLSFTADTKDIHGKAVQYLYVFDRTGP
jgi:hypothetical protein